VWSELSRTLPPAERRALFERHHARHWSRVEAAIRERVEGGRSVVHLGSHTFTPVLDGRPRTCDVGILFDPARRFESEVAARLVDTLKARLPELRIRRNAPYRGVDDGLTRGMRVVFGDAVYAGIEIEVSQRFPIGRRAAWQRVRRAVVESAAAAVRVVNREG
jgi:predicted N-formylglutamate amidohydrolase